MTYMQIKSRCLNTIAAEPVHRSHLPNEMTSVVPLRKHKVTETAAVNICRLSKGNGQYLLCIDMF